MTVSFLDKSYWKISKVGESVARHRHSQPLEVEFVFDAFDD